MADLSRLDLHEQATYWIGASARADTALEGTLVRIWDLLMGPGPGRSLRPRDARQLIDESAKMMPLSTLEVSLQTLGVELLAAAKEQRGKRHRLVHDWWGTDGARMVSRKPGTGEVIQRRELSEFREMVVEATISRQRLEGFVKVATAAIFGRDAVVGWAKESRVYEALMLGNFIARDDGGVDLKESLLDGINPDDYGIEPGQYGAF